MSLNRFIITGNLTRDPECNRGDSGKSFVFLDVASNQNWTDDAGQKQERVTFFRLKDFGKAAENHAQYLRKGSRVVCEGRMQNYQYEKDGQTHYGYDFILDYVEYPPKV